MIGKTLGHYRVLEQIGAGGMGVVYRAHDERLDRDVALKVLPTGTLADEAARKRFRKEALTLSKLNHPSIETIFDFDTQEGVDFLVMELISGITLDQKLMSGPLPEKDVLHLGQQLAEGLGAAHEQGIIHRDLKPGNLRVTPDGRLKVLDFGLAKLVQPASATALTESLSQTHGTAVGTLPYTSPEQLRGAPADKRSDIWAAGAVLYELATGRRPFDAKISTALVGDIQHKAPPSPRQLKPELSLRLEDIILKCMEKDPENRYQLARELGVDLRRLAAPSLLTPTVVSTKRSRRAVPAASLALAAVVVAVLAILSPGELRDRLLGRNAPPQISSIAVLPLQDLSRDPEQDYLADGMTEALIADLSKIGALRVISSASVARYKGTARSPRDVAHELNVDALVLGSVLRDGNRVRITPQLVQPDTDRVLWSDNYERELRDVLALQREVSQAIARQIRVQVTPEDQRRLTATRPVNPEAYELYLKARYYWNKQSSDAVRRAASYFEQAIGVDQEYAPSYVGLADCYISLAHNGKLAPSEAYIKAKTAAAKATEIDGRLAEAHVSIGVILADYDWDWAGAESHLQHALELDPKSATAHESYALVLAKVGRSDEAVAEIKKAKELDPLSLRIAASAGLILRYARRYDEAVQELQRGVDLDPNFKFTHVELAETYALQGRYRESGKEWSLVNDRSERPNLVVANEAIRDAAGYRHAQQIWVKIQTKESEREYVSPMTLATGHARLNERNQTLAWLEQAYRQRDPGLTHVKVNPFFDFLRSDPRFQDILRRMNLPQ